MSPSRAGSDHCSSLKIFNSARLMTFFHSARNRKLAETSWNFDFDFEFFLEIILIDRVENNQIMYLNHGV